MHKFNDDRLKSIAKILWVDYCFLIHCVPVVGGVIGAYAQWENPGPFPYQVYCPPIVP